MTDRHITAVEAVLRDWIADPDITLVCGRWADGSIMEIVPDGRARLSAPRYDGQFAGLRDLEIDGTRHHLHLDLGRLAHAAYVLSPSVCFGFRPSFELRLAGDGARARTEFGFSIAMLQPYRGPALRRDRVTRYLGRAVDHLRRFPGTVSFSSLTAPADGRQATAFDWDGLGACLCDVLGTAPTVGSDREFEAVLAGAAAPAGCARP